MYSLPEPIRHAMESGRAPSPPQILLRLLQMVDDDGTTMAELASLVEQDPGLCTRVLTAANSSALRRGNPLRSIESCLLALGTRLVRSIATCLSVQSLFDERTATRAVDLSGFWTHSLLVAELSRSLAVATRYQQPDEAYLAGLLHDVGELILLSALGEPYLKLLATCPDESALSEMEKERFGVDHGEIGTWLADQWHLDSSFADGILFHHQPAEQMLTGTHLTQVVWLAHALACDDEVSEELGQLAEQMFGNASSSLLSTLRAQAAQRMCMLAEALGMTLQERQTGGRSTSLPRVLGMDPRSVPDTHSQIAHIIGNQALMQPLQEDLFALDSAAEVFSGLRASARILFDLNHLAFLLCDPLDGRLTGQGIAEQAPVFSQVSILPEEQRSLAAAAALSKQIRSSYDRDPPAAKSLMDLQFARAFASNGLLCIPMIGRGGAVGVMVAGLSAGQFARLGRRLPGLANFGRIAGSSLESWRAAQDVRAQIEDAVAERFTRQARHIVHEAGNPLTIIKSYLRILSAKLPQAAEVRHELNILNEEIERVAGIVRRMRDTPEVQADEHTVDLGKLLRELLLLYREVLFDSRGIVVETLLPAQTVRIACDRNSLKQILLNLWKNASEALSRGQRCRISLTDDIQHQGRHFAELKIEDNGPGISEEAMRPLHHPADVRSRGSRGIGLSIVGALAQRLGIPVICRSKPGFGTMIALLLPIPERTPSLGGGQLQQKTVSSPDTSREQP